MKKHGFSITPIWMDKNYFYEEVYEGRKKFIANIKESIDEIRILHEKWVITR
jgi:hypothetical protein